MSEQPNDWGRELLEYHRVSVAPRTATQYVYDLRVMARFLATEGMERMDAVGVVGYLVGLCRDNQLAEASIVIQRFRQWALDCGRLDGSRYSASSVRRVQLSLRKLFSCAFDLHLLREEQIPKVRAVKPEPPIRDVAGPPRDVVMAMIWQCQRRADFKGRRDELAVWLMYANALRIGEVLSVSMRDVDLDDGSIVIRPKGGQRQRIDLPRETVRVLAQYVELRGDGPGPLLLSALHGATDGQPITDDGLRYAVGRLGQAVGRRVRPHQLRHSGISEIARLTNHNEKWITILSRHRTRQLIAQERERMWLRYDDNPFTHREAANIVQRGRPWTPARGR